MELGDMDQLRDVIETTFYSVLSESGVELNGTLSDGTVLLSSGLDSLGFAILVARLDEELGYDPFSLAEDAFYPITYGEFVTYYETHKPS